MTQFRESCNRFCRENLCTLLIAVVTAGASVAMIVISTGLGIDRMARETDLITRNTAGALDAHTALERDNTEQVMRVLGSMQTDLAVIKSRLDASPVLTPGPGLALASE